MCFLRSTLVVAKGDTNGYILYIPDHDINFAHLHVSRLQQASIRALNSTQYHLSMHEVAWMSVLVQYWSDYQDWDLIQKLECMLGTVMNFGGSGITW